MDNRTAVTDLLPPRQVESIVCERLRAAAAGQEGFVAGAGAMLDEIVRLMAAESRLREAVGRPWDWQEVTCRALVESAVAAGELAEADRETAVDTMSAMIVGLVAAGPFLPGEQAAAAEGLKALLNGQLLRS